jgi:hypothetical protein
MFDSNHVQNDFIYQTGGSTSYNNFFRITQYNADAHNTHAYSPYEYTYANPTPMSTSEGLNTDRFGDSQSNQWRLVVDGNVAYHLTHNAGKSWKIQEKVRAPGFDPWRPRSCW